MTLASAVWRDHVVLFFLCASFSSFLSASAYVIENVSTRSDYFRNPPPRASCPASGFPLHPCLVPEAKLACLLVASVVKESCCLLEVNKMTELERVGLKGIPQTALRMFTWGLPQKKAKCP